MVDKLRLFTYRPFTIPLPIFRFFPTGRQRLSDTRPVVILGMHRSGTSLFTKYLSECGLDIGENHLQESFDNPTGFWEDLFFLNTSSDLLRSQGALIDGLDDPDKIESIHEIAGDLVTPGNLARLRVDIDRAFSRRIWGWKDPRTCITFPYFESAFERLGLDEIKLIIVVRSPAEVARSLIRRDTNRFISGEEKVKYDRALRCWQQYNRYCIAYSKRHPTCFVDYRDLLDAESADRVLRRCVAFCGLDRDSYRFPEHVFDGRLVHHKSDGEDLPHDVREVYDYLVQKAREELEDVGRSGAPS